MNLLYEIFDKKIVLEGNKVFESINKHYDYIDSLVSKFKVERYPFNLYYLYPYLFKDDFTQIHNAKINLIAEAGVLYLDNINFYDRYADQQATANFFILFQKSIACQIAMRILSEIFPKASPFWSYFEKYNKEYINAVTLERERHLGTLSEFDDNEFKIIARGKSSVAKASAAALGCICGNYKKIDELELTQDIFAEAFQMLDDLKDIKEDYRLKNYSWILTKLLTEYEVNDELTEKELIQLLIKSNYYELALNKINILCEQAMVYAGSSNSWIRYIKMFQRKADRLKEDLCSLKGNMNNSYFFISSKNTYANSDIKVIINGVFDLLKKEQEKGFPELTHWMLFPHELDYRGKEECQSGDVFQRAFVLNLLLEMKSMQFDIGYQYIDKEISYLSKKKSEIFSNGWSYFPDLPELAPDIDTLSEIIKISDKDTSGILYNDVENSIQFVLKHNSMGDGSYMTWMLDPDDQNELNIRAWNAAKEKWGVRSDPEVTANLLFALSILDYSKYKEVIDRSLQWIFAKQNDDGYWLSTWYAGNYYGSYICSKLFNKLAIKNNHTEKLKSFILSSQREDGSWGTNPHDTALAISALIDLSDKSESKEYAAAIREGLNYLIDTFQYQHNIWNGYDFIKMGKEKVLSKTRSGNEIECEYKVIYKSCTLTTAICAYGISKGTNYLNEVKQ